MERNFGWNCSHCLQLSWCEIIPASILCEFTGSHLWST